MYTFSELCTERRTETLRIQTLTVNETKDEKKVPSSYLDNLDSTPSNTETTWRKSTEKNLNAQCENKYLEWQCGFLFLIFVLISRATWTVNLITFSTSPSAEIKDNLLFAASLIDQTDGNCWITAERETQPKLSPEAGLLPTQHCCL